MTNAANLVGGNKDNVTFIRQHPSISNQGSILQRPFRSELLTFLQLDGQLFSKLIHECRQRSLWQHIFPIRMCDELDAHAGAVLVELAIKGARVLFDVDRDEAWTTSRADDRVFHIPERGCVWVLCRWLSG